MGRTYFEDLPHNLSTSAEEAHTIAEASQQCERDNLATLTIIRQLTSGSVDPCGSERHNIIAITVRSGIRPQDLSASASKVLGGRCNSRYRGKLMQPNGGADACRNSRNAPIDE